MSRSALCPPDDVGRRVANLPRPMVFTNGVFELLHRGHVEYLAQARALGASLVVGLNSDASACRVNKGPGRPLVTCEDRAAVLAALATVDLVIAFDDPAPLALLHRVRPDIYVKGGDYDMDQLPETDTVRSWGGQAIALQFLPGYSSSALVRRIQLLRCER